MSLHSSFTFYSASKQLSNLSLYPPPPLHHHHSGRSQQLLRAISALQQIQMDHGLGQLRSVLENLGEWDNTVLIFFSDNGGVASHGSVNHPFRGGKGDYWEGGVHVPAFISGGFVASALRHNKVEPYRYGHLAHVTDVHATVLALSGYADGGSVALDGFDLWHSLVGTKAPVRQAVVINLNSENFARSGAVRWGKYKLIRNPEPSEAVIYTKVQTRLTSEESKVSEVRRLGRTRCIMIFIVILRAFCF